MSQVMGLSIYFSSDLINVWNPPDSCGESLLTGREGVQPQEEKCRLTSLIRKSGGPDKYNSINEDS